MTVRTLTRPVDTTVIRSRASKALSGLSYYETQLDDAFGYVYFPTPFTQGATIVSATLKLHSYSAPAVSRTIEVRRAASVMNYSRMTFDTKPAVTGATASVTKSTSGPGQEWVFDVTAIMQEVSDGALWWGFRVQSLSTSLLQFHSTQSLYESSRPVLVVEWADEPDKPGDLAPAGGLTVSTDRPVLRFSYSDHGGSTELAGARVQIGDNAAMTLGLWDSGELPVTIPEVDLADTAYPGLPADGTGRFWRVRVKDAAGLWSDWSDATSMRYVERGLVTILEPTSSALMDPTPVVRWSFTGVQDQYEVVVQRGDKVRRPVWDSGRITGTETSYTVPDGILRDDKTYTITVRIWDSEDRASTPGFPAYRQHSATFWFDDDLATPAPTSISATPRDAWPYVDVEWTSASTPDAFMLVREGVIVGRWAPAEVQVEPGRYAFTDRTCPAWVEQRYDVHAIVAEKRSVAASTNCRSEVIGVWLTSPTTTVCLTGKDEGSPTLGVRESVHEVGDRVIVIRDGLRGHEGDWAGELHSDISLAPGVSAKEWRDRLMGMRRDPTGIRLHMGPVNVPVSLSQVNVRSTAATELTYRASFTYHQLPGVEMDDIDEVG